MGFYINKWHYYHIQQPRLISGLLCQPHSWKHKFIGPSTGFVGEKKATLSSCPLFTEGGTLTSMASGTPHTSSTWNTVQSLLCRGANWDLHSQDFLLWGSRTGLKHRSSEPQILAGIPSNEGLIFLGLWVRQVGFLVGVIYLAGRR